MYKTMNFFLKRELSKYIEIPAIAPEIIEFSPSSFPLHLLSVHMEDLYSPLNKPRKVQKLIQSWEKRSVIFGISFFFGLGSASMMLITALHMNP